MKTITDNQINGELGETLVKARILGLGHVFHPLGRLESGLDGILELRNPHTGKMLGKMLGVQVKWRTDGNYAAETAQSFHYTVRTADLAYWKTNNIPVVLILYRQSDDSYFWQGVDAVSPGAERRLVFDKKANALVKANLDGFSALAIDRGTHGAYLPPMGGGEIAHLNMVRLILPDEVFIAETAYKKGGDANPEYLRSGGRDFDWVIRNRRFVSFRDPSDTPAEAIIEDGTVEAVETGCLTDSDDRDDEIVMIELMRRSLERQLSADLSFDRESRSFYFHVQEGQLARSFTYQSLKVQTSAKVISVVMDKKREGKIAWVRHHAFVPRFEKIGSDWFLSITPTFVFTEDGTRPHRFGSILLAGKKRRERNAALRGQFVMWRALLHQSTIVPQPDLLFAVSKPHVPKGFISFEDIEPVAMPEAVPEEAWVRNDPNAKKMQAEMDWAA